MAKLADLGVFGLSTMGANLARNAARKGFGVAVYNRHGARTDELINEHGSEGRFAPAKTIADFVAALARPRPIRTSWAESKTASRIHIAVIVAPAT